MSSIANPYRQQMAMLANAASIKGRVLSHLLGLIIASEFMVGQAAGTRIPYVDLPLFTAWLDFPIRMVALWLLLDRNWRVGRLRLGYFDVLLLGYCGLVGLIYPFTSADPSVHATFEWYRGFAGDMIRYYVIYMLVREGYNRAGFDGRIMIRWILAALLFSAVLGIAQALNLGPTRMIGVTFYQQTPFRDGEPFRAAGTASHWNGFASIMVIGVLLSLAPLNYRALRWYEYGAAGVLTLALLLSTSRGGYATLAAAGVGASIFFLWTRRPRTGATIGSLVALAGLSFVVIVVNFDVPRFHDLVEPPKVRSADLGSLDYRLERARRLTDRGLERPITGTGPSQMMWHNDRIVFRSASSVEGFLDVSYPLIFAEFGLLGLTYMGGLILYFLRFISRARAVHPYAALTFLTGLAFAAHSVTEFLLRGQLMVLISVIAGIAASRVIVRADEFGRRQLEPARLHCGMRHA